MTHRIHSIAVHQLPPTLTLRHERAFLADFERSLRVDRPRILLDCSSLLHMDRPALQLLVFCLEEAMKRNGDVKLAGLSDRSIDVLDRTGVLNLFETYNSTAEAMNSFRHAPINASAAVAEPVAGHRAEAAAHVA